MGHVGLTPQAINTIGSFRAQGREEKDWGPIEDDAKSVADAGAFSLVIEAVAEPLARRITGQVAIPTIGIGASPPATARSWCSRTCWGCRRGCPNSSGNMATSARGSRRRWRAMPRTCAPGVSRARSGLRHEKEVIGTDRDRLLTVGRYDAVAGFACRRHITILRACAGL